MQASVQMPTGPLQHQVQPAQLSSSRSMSQRTHRRAATAQCHHLHLCSAHTLSTALAPSGTAPHAASLQPPGSSRLTCHAAAAAPGWDAFGPDDDDLQPTSTVTRSSTTVLVIEPPPAANQPPQVQPQRAAPPMLPLQPSGPASSQQHNPQARQQPPLLSPAPNRPTPASIALTPPARHLPPPPSTNMQPQFLAPSGQVASQPQRASIYRQMIAPSRLQPLPRWKQLRFQDHVHPNSDISTYDNMPVLVESKSGAAAPPPISSFDRLHCKGFRYSKVLLRAMLAMRYYQPTAIQRFAIPAIAQGRDVCAVSPTGTGKTAAYLLPVLGTLLKQSRDGGPRNTAYPTALILAPTRELVAQIYEIAVRLVKGSHVKVVQLHGGDDIVKQVHSLRGGCDLVIATTGRLLDLVAKKDLHLGKVFMTVVDEADKMMDLGLEHELRRVMTHPQLASSADRQTLLFSTRLGSNLKAVAAQYLRPDYVHVALGHESGAAPLVTHRVVATSDEDKLQQLKQLLASGASTGISLGMPVGIGAQPAAMGGLTIVFTNTMASANQVHEAVVSQLGISASLLHSGLTQPARDEAMDCFRHGLTPVLVTTMLAARGVDVPDAGQVVNWDVPTTMPEYVQRCGRTGRGGRPGTATTLFTSKDTRHAHILVEVMQAVQQQPPDWLVQMATQSKVRLQQRPNGSSNKSSSPQQHDSRPPNARQGRYVGQAAAVVAAQKEAAASPWADLLQPGMAGIGAINTRQDNQTRTARLAAQQGRNSDNMASDRGGSSEEGSSDNEVGLPADDELLQQWYAAIAAQRPRMNDAQARWAAAASGDRSKLAGLVAPLPMPPSVVEKYKQREEQAQQAAREEEQQQQQQGVLQDAAVAAVGMELSAASPSKAFSRRRRVTHSDTEPEGQQQQQGPRISARGTRWSAAFD